MQKKKKKTKSVLRHSEAVKTLFQNIALLMQNITLLMQNIALLMQNIALLMQNIALLMQNIALLTPNIAHLMQNIALLICILDRNFFLNVATPAAEARFMCMSRRYSKRTLLMIMSE